MIPPPENTPYHLVNVQDLSPGYHMRHPQHPIKHCIRHTAHPIPRYIFDATIENELRIGNGTMWLGAECSSNDASSPACIKMFTVALLPDQIDIDDPRREISTNRFLAQNAIWNVIEEAQDWKIPLYRDDIFCRDTHGHHEVAYMTRRVSASELLYSVFSSEYGAPPVTNPRHVFRSILRAMRFLRSVGISHLDISLENILYDHETDTVYIIDFGSSVYTAPNERLPVAPYGKAYFRAPELHDMFRDIHNKTFSPEKADVWSLGMVYFSMIVRPHRYNPGVMCHQLCFANSSVDMLTQFFHEHFPTLHEDEASLLSHMLVADENARYSLEEACHAMDALHV